MAITVQGIVTDALREIGALASGETCPAADAADGMAALNRLIDQWAAERLLIYAEVRYTGTLLPVGTVTYAIAPAGKFTVPGATVFVSKAGYYDSTDATQAETMLEQFGEAEWQAEGNKILTATAPTHYKLERAAAATNIRYWPIPTSATLVGTLYVPSPVTEFTSLVTAIALPAGYRRMLVKNLACELAPSYEHPISADLRQQAVESKGVVKRSNRQDRNVYFPPDMLLSGGGSTYDITVE